MPDMPLQTFDGFVYVFYVVKFIMCIPVLFDFMNNGLVTLFQLSSHVRGLIRERRDRQREAGKK